MSGETPVEVSEVLEALKRIDGRVQSLDEAIRGNGKPGLRQDYGELRAAFLACQQRRDLLEAEREREAGKRWGRFIQPVLQLVYAGIAFLIVFGFAAWTQSANQGEIEAKIQAAVKAAIVEDMRTEK